MELTILLRGILAWGGVQGIRGNVFAYCHTISLRERVTQLRGEGLHRV